MNAVTGVLLGRDAFRDAVFSRDGGTCLLCPEPAQDAHHILERRLWPDGGYYLENGASLCETHHLEAEMTTLPCETLRETAGIERVILPPHLYRDVRYDKWGNPYREDGTRTPGELFWDESVQRILRAGGVLDQFSYYVKYPRTYHVPGSPGATSDDRIVDDLSGFEGREVVITVKLDGENTTIYSDGYVHARSLDSSGHPSRSWVANRAARLAPDLPAGWRLCGENLYAVHSIRYGQLDGYLYGFSLWDERNHCLDWDTTREWFDMLEVPTVPVLYRGVFDPKVLPGLFSEVYDGNEMEGWVLRTVEGFEYREFRTRVVKWVRPDHVRTAKHWFTGQKIERNGQATSGRHQQEAPPN